MYRFLTGYSKIEFTGDEVLKCFECLQNNGIQLKNIKKVPCGYLAEIKRNRLKTVRDISTGFCVEIKVCRSYGVASKFIIHKKRYILIGGAIICAALFFVRALFVREIVISGNAYLTDEQVELVLSECGVERGKFIPNLKPNKISEQMIDKCKHFSWVWIDIKGTTAFVDIREKHHPLKLYDKSYACNIVAKKDGIISEAISESGINYATVGKYVRKGELLIGGIYDSNDYAPVRYVRAKGKVLAKTKYSLSDTYCANYYLYRKKGEVAKKVSANFFGFSVGKSRILNKNVFLAKSANHNLIIFGKKFSSLGFTNERYYEIIKEEYKMDMQTARQRAVDELSLRLRAYLPDGAEVIKVETEIEDNPDKTFCVTVFFDCIEDIGKEAEIQID